jgi:hypothetical protein
MASYIERRKFLATLGGAAVAWPLAARAQERDRMRRIGVLMNLAADDPEAPARVAAFAQGLQELGWTMDRNVRIDYRWGAGVADLYRRYGAELVALAPDLLPPVWRPCALCSRRAARCRWCLWAPPIRSPPGSSPVSRGRAAMRQGLCSLSSA